MRRALSLLAALALPSLAAAQSVGAITVETSRRAGTYLGLQDCSDAARTIKILWNVNPGTGGFRTGGVFRVYAANKISTTNNTSGFCPTDNDTSQSITAGKVGADITAGTQNGSATLPTQEILSKAGLGQCNIDGATVYLCVHWFPDGTTQTGLAKATFTLQTAPPSIPTTPTVGSADRALEVNWSDGSGGGATTSYFTVTATPTDTTQDSAHTADTDNATGHVRVGGLKNGVEYSVHVQAVSRGGNLSDPSGNATGTPRPGVDFWDWYRSQGGVENGGCSTGAGGLALLGVASLLAFRRRRSR